MSVNVGENGRRSVQVEVEVPGSPEEVWEAIATGPGISSWFVPTDVDGRVGGSVTANFGPGMESVAKITGWTPPRRFSAESEGLGQGAPAMATEWVVESKSGGTCVVRVVHSWFADSDAWDGQFESVEQGWTAFFNILRLKLEHFRGLPGAAFDTPGISSGAVSEVWGKLTAELGLSDAAIGQEVRSGADAPTLAGTVKVSYANPSGETNMLLLTTQPGPGICHLMAIPMGEQTYLSIRFFLFGDTAPAVVAKAQPEWSLWFGERFPMGG